jgi:hypothetical protein
MLTSRNFDSLGLAVIDGGYSYHHKNDVHTFMNIITKAILHLTDLIWLNQTNIYIKTKKVAIIISDEYKECEDDTPLPIKIMKPISDSYQSHNH